MTAPSLKRGNIMNPTLRYSLIYGGLAAIVLAIFIVVVGFLHERVDWVATTTFGYSVMLVAMSFVFVGVKRYRDVEGGGVIKFSRAFGLGLGIALIAGLAYVLIWELYLAATHYRFFDDYVAKMLRDAHSSGKGDAEIAKMSAEMDSLRTMYANPLFRLPMTFAEIAPVGLLVALVSAALLRNPKLLPARMAHGA
jgi:hypothetical protein